MAPLIFAQKSEGGFNFTKEIHLNQNSEKLKILLKKVKGVNFPEEIPLNEISENSKILLKNSLRRIRYFCIQNSKNPDPHKDFFSWVQPSNLSRILNP